LIAPAPFAAIEATLPDGSAGLRQKAFSSVYLDAWVRLNRQKLLDALESE
jgi:hypothetical protein